MRPFLVCLLLGLLSLPPPALAGNGRGTLLVENRTDATLHVHVLQEYPFSTQVQWEADAPRDVPPRQNVSYFNFLPQGAVFVYLTAPRTPVQRMVARKLWVSGTGQYRVQVAAADFGVGSLADGPAAPFVSEVGGTWQWFTGGDVTFRTDGTLVQGNLTGTWLKYGRSVQLSWSHGYFDTLTLSADGRSLDGYGNPKSDPSRRYKVWGRKR